jgi:hypothetical protein
MDEFRGAVDLIDVELLSRPVGRIWPWIVLVVGALVVAAGAALYSPDTDFASSGPSTIWFG